MESTGGKSVSQEQSSQQTEKRIENWSKLEKYQLLQALKTHGSHNIEILMQEIPSKTSEEIEEALQVYRSKASAVLNCSAKKLTKSKVKMREKQVPLSEWTNILHQSYNFKELSTETATAVRIIAEFEKIPLPHFTNEVNFRHIYHLIASALEGRTLPLVNGVTSYTIHKSLLETAIATKGFISDGDLQVCVGTMTLSDQLILTRPTATDNAALANIQHLASLCNYNPLGLSVGFLKPSKQPSFIPEKTLDISFI